MKMPLTQPRGLFFIGCILLALFWLGLESEVFARAGGGRSFGSRGYSSGGSYQRTPARPPLPNKEIISNQDSNLNFRRRAWGGISSPEWLEVWWEGF